MLDLAVLAKRLAQEMTPIDFVSPFDGGRIAIHREHIYVIRSASSKINNAYYCGYK